MFFLKKKTYMDNILSTLIFFFNEWMTMFGYFGLRTHYMNLNNYVFNLKIIIQSIQNLKINIESKQIWKILIYFFWRN
jgi:hypothetical protein